jgi:transcriptional regulator with XRE-family HTH domain
MGFRENLKEELFLSGMMVKELAAQTGIKKYTLDNYLSVHNSTPSAEAAVKIARTLGVSVEYLVLGREGAAKKSLESLTGDTRRLVLASESLTPGNRKILLALAETLKNLEKTAPR